MREDMAHILVERPRLKPRKSGKGRPQKLEEAPGREGMRRGWTLRGELKELNENLQPLRRYLARQVGRPWDKVYSEIAAHLRVECTVQHHLRGHLKDFVAITPRRGVHGAFSGYRHGLWRQEFYVDPASGLLCRTDRLPEFSARRRGRRCPPAAPIQRVQLSESRELRLIEGLWYELTLAPLPAPAYRSSRETRTIYLKGRYAGGPAVTVEMDVRRLTSPPVRDAATGAFLALGPSVDEPYEWVLYRRAQPERRYAIAKRALSRQELRRHALRNDQGS